MKNRFGYVSNSSSSSFIVLLVDTDGNATNVTKEQEQMLFGYGFRYVKNEYWKNALTDGAELVDNKDEIKEKNQVAMYYYISCNEDEVEDFLFENHIPFFESEHYNMKLNHYDGVHDYYDTVLNEGTMILTYCFDGNESYDRMLMREACKRKPFSRIRISDGADITDSLLEGGK